MTTNQLGEAFDEDDDLHEVLEHDTWGEEIESRLRARRRLFNDESKLNEFIEAVRRS